MLTHVALPLELHPPPGPWARTTSCSLILLDSGGDMLINFRDFLRAPSLCWSSLLGKLIRLMPWLGQWNGLIFTIAEEKLIMFSYLWVIGCSYFFLSFLALNGPAYSQIFSALHSLLVSIMYRLPLEGRAHLAGVLVPYLWCSLIFQIRSKCCKASQLTAVAFKFVISIAAVCAVTFQKDLSGFFLAESSMIKTGIDWILVTPGTMLRALYLSSHVTFTAPCKGSVTGIFMF